MLAHFFTGLENLPSSPFLLGCTGNGNKEVVLGTGGKMGKFLILDGNSAFCSIGKEVLETKQIADLGLLFSGGSL